jgi:ABC-type antimicrobial peptide transport system permease subunit
MVILFPVTLAVSVLIAAGLAVLKTIQNNRTVAGLRALGVTRSRITMMLCCEQGVVCALGLLAGLGVLTAIYALLDADAAGALTRAGMYIGGTLAGSVGGAWAAVGRRPLELLQTRD